MTDPDHWLSDELLFHYQRCNRRAFLDFCEDSTKRDPPSDYLLKLGRDSQDHQKTILEAFDFHRPQYPHRNWQAGADATLELMQQGVEQIRQGVLIAQGEQGFQLVSRPKLLIRQPGQSNLGDWSYAPIDIKLGKRPKRDYQIVAAFHAYVLAAVQGIWPDSSQLFLRERGPYVVDLSMMVPEMEQILQACTQALRSPDTPEVFIAHNRCNLCQWFSHCYSTARAERHLSLLPGVTPARYTQLQTLDLITLPALATASATDLEDLPGFGTQVAQKLVVQAKSTLQNRAIPSPLTRSSASFLLDPEDLPTANTELYFDIEAAPEHDLVYLHGVLVVDRLAQTETFYGLVAESKDREEAVWNQFLDLVWQYPEAPVYHFCPYEVQTVRRLAEKYGSSMDQIEWLLTRFVDLHKHVTQSVTLPVESYALKHIARWIGFDWRDAEANGAQSICWYDQWLETGDRTFLKRILDYNEDDCRATYRVKDWLVEFAQPFWQQASGE